MSPENRSNDGAPIAVHRAVDLLYEVGAWLHDVACGDAEFDAMHDALDGRLVPFADAALSEARSSLAAVERERDQAKDERRERFAAMYRREVVQREAAEAERGAALARLAAVKAWRQSISGWLDSIPPREILRNLDRALAASPTPTGPEPAECACPRRTEELHRSRCPLYHEMQGDGRGPSTPTEPTEETP